MLSFMVRPERFELPAFWFVARRSIQLSYGRTLVVSPETSFRLSGIMQWRNLRVRPREPVLWPEEEE
jgi:hypothetical protein